MELRTRQSTTSGAPSVKSNVSVSALIVLVFLQISLQCLVQAVFSASSVK